MAMAQHLELVAHTGSHMQHHMPISDPAAGPLPPHQELALLLPPAQLVLNGHQLAGVPPGEAQVAQSKHGGPDGQSPAAVAAPAVQWSPGMSGHSTS